MGKTEEVQEHAVTANLLILHILGSACPPTAKFTLGNEHSVHSRDGAGENGSKRDATCATPMIKRSLLNGGAGSEEHRSFMLRTVFFHLSFICFISGLVRLLTPYQTLTHIVAVALVYERQLSIAPAAFENEDFVCTKGTQKAI
jgi:hypothetical protein